MVPPSAGASQVTNWLIRIPEVFAPFAPEILAQLGCQTSTPLGPEYHVIRALTPDVFRRGPMAPFISWSLPIHHSWPCHPAKMDSFIEKAAQTLLKKFAPLDPQAIQMGPLLTSTLDRYYKSLASNLRGRTLQLFPGLTGSAPAEAQHPDRPTLFCLVGKEGLFAGLQSPRQSNGFHPGGTKFIKQKTEETISRAGAKIAEALHYLLLHRPALAPSTHWLELGASPGGMTSELLHRGYRVTALDRAPLDPRISKHPHLTFSKTDAAHFKPPAGTTYDAILCDMNGDARSALRQVIRLTRFMHHPGLIVFTLKTPGTETLAALQASIHRTLQDATAASLELIAISHLTYNRQEFTCFFDCRPPLIRQR